MRKLTPEKQERLKAKLDQQSIEKAEKEQKKLKRKKRKGFGLVATSILSPAAGAVAQKELAKSKKKELERQKPKKRTGSGPGLRQMKLTEEEKRELAARIRGDK